MYKQVDKPVAMTALTGFFHHCLYYLTGQRVVLSLFSKKYTILQKEKIRLKWQLLLSVKTSWHSKLYNYQIPLLLNHIAILRQFIKHVLIVFNITFLTTFHINLNPLQMTVYDNKQAFMGNLIDVCSFYFHFIVYVNGCNS